MKYLLTILLFIYSCYGSVLVLPLRNLKTKEPDLTGLDLKYYIESLIEESDSKTDLDFIAGLKSTFNEIDPVETGYVITGSYLFNKGKWKVYVKISDSRTCLGKTYYFEGNSLCEIKSKMREEFLKMKPAKEEVKNRLKDLENGTINDVVNFRDFMLSIPTKEYDWEMHFLLGEANRILGNFEEAYDCYEKSLGVAEDDYQKVTIMISVGMLCRQMREYNKAIEIYDKALKKCNDPVQKCVLLNNKANVLYDIGKKDLAVKTWKESLKYADPRTRKVILNNLEDRYETNQNNGN